MEDSVEAAEGDTEVRGTKDSGSKRVGLHHFVSCQVVMVEDTGPVEAATGTTVEEDNRTEGIKDGLSDQNEEYDYDVYMIMIMIMLSDVLRTHGLI